MSWLDILTRMDAAGFDARKETAEKIVAEIFTRDFAQYEVTK